MDKRINLVMNDDGVIAIYMNDQCKLQIDRDNRQINAKELYDLLDYSPATKYSVTKKNEAEVDGPVLDELFSLFEKICSSLNDLSVSSEDEH